MKISNKKIKFTLALLILVFASFSFSARPAKADYWNGAMLASIWKRTMERIDKKMDALIMSIAKEAAINTIANNVTSMISGESSGSPLFIDNWENFLFEEPHTKTRIYMNDFFSSITGGRGSSSYDSSGIALNYEAGSYSDPSCSSSGAKCVEGASTSREGVVKGSSTFNILGQNYENYLIQQAKNVTTDIIQPKTDLRNYVSDPSQMFSTGNWRAFSSFVSNPANNPFGFSLLAQEEYHAEEIKNQKLAEIQGVSYGGFKAVTSDGVVTTPGSTIKDIQSQTLDLGNKIVAAADDPEEVIVAVVNKVVNEAFSGIGRQISSTIRNYTREANQSVSKATSGFVKLSY